MIKPLNFTLYAVVREWSRVRQYQLRLRTCAHDPQAEVLVGFGPVAHAHHSATPPSRLRTVEASDDSMPPKRGLRSCLEDCLSQQRTAPPCVPRMSDVQSSERYLGMDVGCRWWWYVVSGGGSGGEW
jgi:hypothetical protein